MDLIIERMMIQQVLLFCSAVNLQLNATFLKLVEELVVTEKSVVTISIATLMEIRSTKRIKKLISNDWSRSFRTLTTV